MIVFLFACQMLEKTTITFETNGGTSIESLTVQKDSSIVLPDDPIKEGYTFLGWYLDSLFEDAFEQNIELSKSITLYAKWSPNLYTISFQSNSNYDDTPIHFYVEEQITLPTITKENYSFNGWYMDESFNEMFTLTHMPAHNLVLYAKWSYTQTGLPVFHITLPHTQLYLVSREFYVDAFISITNTQDEYVITNEKAELRGRGNGSWTYDKKGYRIKFESRQSLFGEARSRHWVLVAGGHDQSSVRNHVAYSLVNDVLDHIEYQTSVYLVEVYVNQNYHGVYSLFEHIRVDKDRIDIESEYGILDTGYLLEYDSYASGTNGIDYFRVSGLKYPFSIKSPDPTEFQDSISESTYRAQINYIKNYMESVFGYVFAHDFESLSTLVDVNSMVDMYIIHELFKNTDTGWSSFYLYKKPGGKLYFGPAWDFDFSSGISRGESSYQGLYVSNTIRYHSGFTSSELYIELMKQETFVQLVKDRYIEVHELIHQKINELFQEILLYEDAFQRDGQRWWINTNWKMHQQALQTWLLNRNNWLYQWAHS